MNRYEKFIAAIRARDTQRVGEMLSQRMDPNWRDDHLRTPLHFAAAASSPEVVDLLVKAGANVEVSTGWDFRPLHFANCVESARVLVNAGADITSRNGIGNKGRWNSLGNLPLHSAVWYDKMDVADFMVCLGVDVNSQNDDGTTVLHEAAACHGLEIVDQLLNIGADPNRADLHGVRPLQLAIRNAQLANALRLIDANAQVTDEDEARLSAMMREEERLLKKHRTSRCTGAAKSGGFSMESQSSPPRDR